MKKTKQSPKSALKAEISSYILRLMETIKDCTFYDKLEIKERADLLALISDLRVDIDYAVYETELHDPEEIAKDDELMGDILSEFRFYGDHTDPGLRERISECAEAFGLMTIKATSLAEQIAVEEFRERLKENPYGHRVASLWA